MHLLAVLQARLTAITNLYEWDHRNKVYAMDLVQRLVERYGFLTFPKTIQDYRSSTGAAFGAGRMGEIIIENFTLYAQGVVIDTRSSTDDCDRVFIDAAKWIAGMTGIEFSEERITRRFYVSQVSFSSDLKLESLNPKLKAISERLTEIVSKSASRQIEFETTGISFQVDHSKNTSLFWQPMRIERLEGSSFQENKYFSAAPTSTDEHIHLLEEFEKALIS
jgi:hypothetical protein